MTPPARVAIEDGAAADLDDVMIAMAEAFDPAFGEAWTEPQCLGILGMPGTWLLVARRDGEPVGFALARAIADEAELLLLAVRPRFRGRGIGKALLDRVMADARARGIATLHLEVRSGNDAIRLYAVAGFSEVGVRRDYYRGSDGRSFDALSFNCPVK